MEFAVWQALLLLLSAASAQMLTPINTSNGTNPGANILLGIFASAPAGQSGPPIAVFPVTALTDVAAQSIASAALTGYVILADNQNSLTLKSTNVALISCDPSTSNLGPSSVFNAAKDVNVSAVVLYTTTKQSCFISGYDGYRNIYTLQSADNAKEMVSTVQGSLPWGVLGPRDTVKNGTGGNPNNNNPANPLGPSPSTAVAMIILYSITGVITALFLCIIITGAVRAHRHPERYGPRNVVGRARQTRARGLARAMLDSLPIVKVGDRTGGDPAATKPTDVELENGTHGPVEYVGDQMTTARAATENDTSATTNAKPEAEGEPSNSHTQESGIAAAATTPERSASTVPDETSNLGCSICTEDFEVGEDQRVLPCDHRFHPACIDPWLLNVSGTCPLCRIDLRPPEEAEGAELDENGNPVARDGLAPPLESGEESRGARVRRSIMMSVLGVARPERMSREERVAALRRYRQNAASTEAAERQASTNSEPQAEEETRRRRRYRDLFRIRTRRTGEAETVAEEPARDAAANAATSNEARTS